MNIVLTGGGTGGHIYPAISIGQALRELRPEAELLFVGSSHGPEGEIARGAGIDFQAVPSSPLTRTVSFRNSASLMRLVAGVFRARRILTRFGADVAVGTGGYTTAAVLLAQRMRRGRVVIHEQNAVPGRANRWLSRIADKVCISFEGSGSVFPEKKVVLTGLPIRKEFASLPGKAEARHVLKLDEFAFTVLVVGGSQGARAVNNLIAEALPHLWDDIQVYHQVGERNVQEFCHYLDLHYGEGMPETYRMETYVDMPVAMAAADLVVGRSGASTVFEIAAAGLPSILIPFPHAISDEQRKNAACLAERGAALVLEEKSATAETLTAAIKGIKETPGKLAEMAAASKRLAIPDAAKRVAEQVVILSEAKNLTPQ